MPSVTRRYSVADVRAIPDDRNRYETVAGELFVTPAPSLRHQMVLGRLFNVLSQYVERHHLGWVFFAPTDVVFGPYTLVEPDVLFVPRSRRDLMTDREITGAPELVIEVLSPSTARTDRGKKRALYREQGVREYWIVDADKNAVEIWRLGTTAAEVVRDSLTWHPTADAPALTIDLLDIFKPL